MKLQGVGNVVRYHPDLALVFNSVNAALLACQFVYWADKGRNPHGWIYKTAEEIEAETGLTYDQQRTARKQLKEWGLLEEDRRRHLDRMYYRIRVDDLLALYSRVRQYARENALPLREAGREVLEPPYRSKIRIKNEQRREPAE